LDLRVSQRTSELAVSNEELKRSEARKTAILDSALDCIITIDHEARITEFNPAAERTFGHRRDEVVGRPLADVIIPESQRENHRQGFSRYLSTGEAHVLGRRLELTAMRANGSEFPVELAITRIPISGPPSFTGYLRDITERKQAEEKLRRSEAYLAEAQRLSHTGSFGWKLSSGDITWSEESFRIFEYDPKAKPTIELILNRVHPEDIAPVSRWIERASQDRKDWELKHRLLMPDGTVKHVHVVAHAVGGHSEKFEYVGAIMDVTERRRSEEALRKARANLAHVSRLTTVGELTASIAHEVNQPLAAVVTNANASLRWLEHEPPNFGEARAAIQRIIRDGNRGSDVIRRIRGLVKKEGPSTARLHLNEVVRETIALAGVDLHGTSLQTELADELPQVRADRVQLQQVLLNLMLNAMDAMKPVTDRPHVLRIQTKCNEGRTVLVVVEDSGVGLSSEGMERLFETFYTTKPEGLGMGLSICRSIIEGHGGRLWAESTEGAGTRFQFTLPIERGSPL
jgi:PAS domain S-box-containing protein